MYELQSIGEKNKIQGEILRNGCMGSHDKILI